MRGEEIHERQSECSRESSKSMEASGRRTSGSEAPEMADDRTKDNSHTTSKQKLPSRRQSSSSIGSNYSIRVPLPRRPSGSAASNRALNRPRGLAMDPARPWKRRSGEPALTDSAIRSVSSGENVTEHTNRPYMQQTIAMSDSGHINQFAPQPNTWASPMCPVFAPTGFGYQQFPPQGFMAPQYAAPGFISPIFGTQNYMAAAYPPPAYQPTIQPPGQMMDPSRADASASTVQSSEPVTSSSPTVGDTSAVQSPEEAVTGSLLIDDFTETHN